MLDLVGNPEDRFSQNEAHIQFTEKKTNYILLHDKGHTVGWFLWSSFSYLKFFLFALLLLHAFVT